jgi:hypothetical protein
MEDALPQNQKIKPCENAAARRPGRIQRPSRILQLTWQPPDRQAARESRHHKGVKRTGSSPLPPPIPISTFFAMLGSDDIETAAKTPITAAVMIMRT